METQLISGWRKHHDAHRALSFNHSCPSPPMLKLLTELKHGTIHANKETLFQCNK